MPSTGQPGTPDRRAFAILWFGQFTSVAGLTVVVPLLPLYLAGLGLPGAAIPWWTGVLLAAPAATQLVTAPLWGMVGDRYGHKTTVVRAHAGLAVAVGLMALADTPGEFLACRLLQGACGGVVSASTTYASSLAATGRHGRALGGLFSATGAGCLLGPLAGSVLAGRFGFGALFGCVAALLLASTVLTLTLLPHPKPQPWSQWTAIRRPTPGNAVTNLLHQRRTRYLLLAGLAGQAASYALVVVFAPRVERITDSIAAATVWVGGLQAATWAASLLGAPWWGWRNDRRPAHRGFAVAAACCGLAVALQALPTTPEMLLPLRFAQGFCFAALAQSVLHVVYAASPGTMRGTTLGTSNGLLDLGQVMGPFLGALAASMLPTPGAFAAIGVLLGVAAGLAVLSSRQPPASAARVPPPALTKVEP
jgi:MFS transporter, DHA1 family, staphyloferrin B biosynthesis exporter